MLLDIPRRLTGHGLNRFLTSGLLLYGKGKKNFHTSAIAMSNCLLQGFFSIEIQSKVDLKDMKT